MGSLHRSEMQRGIYGVVDIDADHTVVYIGRTKQIERRLKMLRHQPWVYRDDRYQPVPLQVEPFPEPFPQRLVEQSAFEFYAKEARRKRRSWRRR